MSKSQTVRHEKCHTCDPRPFTCKLCSASFDLEPSLRRHRVVHGVESFFQCQKCKTLFYEKSELEQHGLFHADEGPHKTCHVGPDGQQEVCHDERG